MDNSFFESWIMDWIVMAMISGIGLVAILFLLALLGLLGLKIARKLRSFWPDVM